MLCVLVVALATLPAAGPRRAQAEAQEQTGTVVGVVYGSDGPRPLEGVDVRSVKQNHIQTYTDENGKYTLGGLDKGEHRLTLIMELYEPESVQVNIPPNDEAKARPITLIYKGISIEVVVRLQKLLEDKKLKELGEELERYSGFCEDIEERDCSLVRKAQVQFGANNLRGLAQTLAELRATKDAGALRPCPRPSPQAAPPTEIAKDRDNGITVGQTKVYDERSFRQKIRALEAGLASLRFLNQASVAGAGGRIQGARLNTSSLGVSVSTLPVPGVTTTTNTGSTATANEVVTQSATPSTVTTANTVSPDTVNQVVTQPPFTPAAPALPGQTSAFGLQQPVGLSAQDTLVEQVLLQQQVAEMQLFLESSLTDRVFNFPPDAAGVRALGQRKSSIFGFWVTIDPERRRDAVAEVEIVLKSECEVASEGGTAQKEAASLVLLLPREKTYNVATATKDSKSLNVGTVLQVISAGVSAGKTSETLYIVGDTDTVSMERRRPHSGADVAAPDASITFGWQFRPVLGRRAVAPGTRQVYALVALPQDSGSGARPFVGTIRAYTRWRSFDAKTKMVGRVLRDSESYTDLNNLEVDAAPAEAALAPYVNDVRWEDAGGGQVQVSVSGGNFLDGVSVLAGSRHVAGPEQGLAVQGDRSLLLLLPTQQFAQMRNPVLLGRYGGPIQLMRPITSAATQPGYGIQIVSAIATPVDAQNSKVVVTLKARVDGAGGASVKPEVLYEDYDPSTGTRIYKHRPANPIVSVGDRAFGFADAPVVKDASKATELTLTFVAPTATLKQAQKLGVRELFEAEDYYDEKPVTFRQEFGATKSAVMFADERVTQLAITGSGFDRCKLITVMAGGRTFTRSPDNPCPAAGSKTAPDNGARDVNFLSPSLLAVNLPRALAKAAKQIVVVQEDASAPAAVALSGQPSPEPGVQQQEALVEGDVKTIKLTGSNFGSVAEIRFEGQNLSFEAGEDGASLNLTASAALTTKAGDKQLNFVLKDGKTKTFVLKVSKRG